MAQSLIKKLEKTEVIEVDEEDNQVMNVKFTTSKSPGKVVIEAEDLSKAFGKDTVFKDVDFLIERNSKIAFVGQNGQGKSTLAKIIVGELEHGGSIKLGHNVQIGYFAQNQAEYLDGNKTVLDTMLDAANESNRSRVRDILGSFLFRGDDVGKFVKVLSGGERNRLALAKMSLTPFNVLIMDEPTNHLDIQSKNVLKAALNNFDGTLILVSHDRDFLQGLADSIYEFRNHQVKEFLGDINDYLKYRELESMREVEKKDKQKKQDKTATSNKNDYEFQKKQKSLQNKLSGVESKISKLEKEIKKSDQDLALKYEEIIKQPNFFDTYNAKKKQLETLMKSWEDLQVEIESL
jgi:ATP-binding cassette subfamily F protein 3